MIYLLDSTTVSDMIADRQNVISQVDQHLLMRDKVAICHPVYYELKRGLLWKGALRKLRVLEERIIPKLDWFRLEDDDWILAVDYWAKTVKAGRSLSDMDFLLASMVTRLDAILVSSDNDFDALPVKREDWR